MRRSVACFLLLLFAFDSSSALQTPSSVTTEFQVMGRGRTDTWATSSYSCGTFLCSFNYSVRASLIDYFFVSFHWDVGLRLGKFKGWLWPVFGDDTETSWNTTSVFGTVVAIPGAIDFYPDSPFAPVVSGTAHYHQLVFGPSNQVPLKSTDDEVVLKGTAKPAQDPAPALLQNLAVATAPLAATAPPEVSFESSAKRLASGEILFSYLIVNNTEEMVSALWPSAGLDGDIEPGQSLARSVTSANAARQVLDGLTIQVGEFGTPVEGPVYTLAPVPLPPALLPLTAALALLPRWRRSREKG